MTPLRVALVVGVVALVFAGSFAIARGSQGGGSSGGAPALKVDDQGTPVEPLSSSGPIPRLHAKKKKAASSAPTTTTPAPSTSAPSSTPAPAAPSPPSGGGGGGGGNGGGGGGGFDNSG